MNKRIAKKKSTQSLINAQVRSQNRMASMGYKAIVKGKIDLSSVLTEAYKSYKANAAIRRREDEIRTQMKQLENKDRSRRRGVNKNKWTAADLRKYNNLQSQLRMISPTPDRGPGFETDFNNAERYAILKKYHDYVDRGIIKNDSRLDNYNSWGMEEAIDDFYNSLAPEELEDLIAEAREKEAKMIADSLARKAKYGNFGF